MVNGADKIGVIVRLTCRWLPSVSDIFSFRLHLSAMIIDTIVCHAHTHTHTVSVACIIIYVEFTYGS